MLFQNQHNETNSGIRFNEKQIGPIFDGLFRDIKFKITFLSNDGKEVSSKKEIHFLNDFICKTIHRYSSESIEQGHTEKMFLKLMNPKQVLELNIVKLNSES